MHDDGAPVCGVLNPGEVARRIARTHFSVNVFNRSETGSEAHLGRFAARQRDLDQRAQPKLSTRDAALRNGGGTH